MNQVLGGTEHSRLFMNLRETKGIAYYAFSTIEFLKKCSFFFIRAKVRPEETNSAITEIMKEINKISTRKIPAYEIEQAKSYLIGNFPLKIDTTEELSSVLSEILALSLGDNYWHKYIENIKLVDSDQVFKTAQELSLLTPVIFIVGNRDRIVPRMENLKIEIFNEDGVPQYIIEKGENP
jgi:predicted Zn-dependent peptidase